MSCCNKTIKKISNIAEGKISAITERLFNVEVLKCEKYDLRIEICSSCNKRTYLTKTEYTTWLIQNGKEIVENFTELEKLPALPRGEQRDGTYLCCRLCKCDLEAKCRVTTEQCPIGRW